jgi:geranylgeranyl pyrophosphate synthase
VEILHAGSLIVDDIQDGSRQRRGRAALHHLIGLPLALNTGNWLYFWPLTLISNVGLPPAAELKLQHRIADTLRQCHEGQALDLSARISELHPSEIYGLVQVISERKTGSLMALAAVLGSVAAGADDQTIDALSQFGERLGVGLQMQNDLSELTGNAGPLKHPEDLLHGRVTWPWAWAAERLPAAQFDALQTRGAKLAAGTGDAAALARDLLAALGRDPMRPVRIWLTAALDDLATAIPAGPALEAIQAEVGRLERKYT